jgi:hypothetical protein
MNQTFTDKVSISSEEKQLDEDREFFSHAHRTGYDQGFRAGIDYQKGLNQSLGLFSKDAQIAEFKRIVANRESDLANATTAIESLQATIAQLTAQLTQLQSAKIAREDVAPAQPDHIN